jgi:hypothetical protein
MSDIALLLNKLSLIKSTARCERQKIILHMLLCQVSIRVGVQ